jgi:hypothetical protein
MNTRQKMIVYGLLGLLLATNLSLIVERTTRTAHADDDARNVLGPVDALALADTGKDGDLVLKSTQGRLSWSDKPYDRVHSVAYVFIGKILNQLMQSDEMTEDRERLMNELNETEASYRERLDAIRGRILEFGPESPDSQPFLDEGSAVYQEYMGWQQEAMAQRGKLDADQLEVAYGEMLAAVQVVGEREGIDTVYRFIPTDEEFQAENPEQAMMAIRLRTALRYPPELDITDLVIEELSLDLE